MDVHELADIRQIRNGLYVFTKLSKSTIGRLVHWLHLILAATVSLPGPVSPILAANIIPSFDEIRLISLGPEFNPIAVDL